MKKDFFSLWKDIGAKGSPNAEWNFLKGSYSQERRYHHNMRHIDSMLQELELLSGESANPLIVKLAIFYHDAVYDPHMKNNEESSALLLKNLKDVYGVDTGIVLDAFDLVMATKLNFIPRNSDERVIVDCDSAILGKSHKIFSSYESNIRKEYSFVASEIYAAARIDILKGFLDKRTIYNSPIAIELYESNARKNIRRSIDELQKCLKH